MKRSTTSVGFDGYISRKQNENSPSVQAGLSVNSKNTQKKSVESIKEDSLCCRPQKSS